MVTTFKRTSLKRTYAKNLYEPLNPEFVTIMVGILMGDGHARVLRGKTYIKFVMGGKNLAYGFWVHQQLSSMGFCSSVTPKIVKTKEGYYRLQFCTYSYEKHNFLHEAFYIEKKKVIPPLSFLETYFSEKSLAFMFMDDGGNVGKNCGGFHLNTNIFSKEELQVFMGFLNTRFGLNTSLHSINRLYIKTDSAKKFVSIVKPYLHESMLYKVEKYL